MKIAIKLSQKRKWHHERARDSGKSGKIPPFKICRFQWDWKIVELEDSKKETKRRRETEQRVGHMELKFRSIITNNDKVIACFPNPRSSSRYSICIHPYDVFDINKHEETSQHWVKSELLTFPSVAIHRAFLSFSSLNLG